MSLISLTLPPSPDPNPTYILTLNAPPDHRLTEALLTEFTHALDSIERDWWVRRQAEGDVGGAVIIRGEGEKFFSNGLDYENSLKNPDFHPLVFNPFYIRLITFPLITIAAINGHAFAGGYMLALGCDLRVMKEVSKEGRKAWCCMNEIDFGAPFPPLFATTLRTRLPPSLLKRTLLGQRFTSDELLVHGVLDAVSPSSDDGLMTVAQSLAKEHGGKSAGAVWGVIKEGVWKEIVESSRDIRLPLMPSQVCARAARKYGLTNGEAKL